MADETTAVRDELVRLLSLGALSETYVYAPELGAYLLRYEPELLAHVSGRVSMSVPMQARMFTLVAEIDATGWTADLVDAAAFGIANTPEWRRELSAALRYEQEHHRSGRAQRRVFTEAVSLPGVAAYIPDACVRMRHMYDDIGWALEALNGLERRPSRRATLDELAVVHPEDFLDELSRFSAAGGGRLDPDTHITEWTFPGVLAGAGAVLSAVDDIEAGLIRHAYVLARPASHHAGLRRPMGTCVVNNLALGARRAAELGARVAVVDIDAHHGNGTQELLAGRSEVLTISVHERGLYPGTGMECHPAANVWNFPLGGRSDFDGAWTVALDLLDAHRPEVILVEGSFDAHEVDIISNLGWTDATYRQVFHDLARRAPMVVEVGSAGVPDAFMRGQQAALRGTRDAVSLAG